MPSELQSQVHKIDVQVGVILTHLEREIGSPSKPGTIAVALAELRSDVKQIDRMLLGANGHPGLAVRLDRLEQIHKSRARLEVAGMTALTGLLLKALWEVLIHVNEQSGVRSPESGKAAMQRDARPRLASVQSPDDQS